MALRTSEDGYSLLGAPVEMGMEGSWAEQTGGGEMVESTTMFREVVVDSGDVLDVWDELEDDPLDLAPRHPIETA